jgi:putative tryptophan/tyrosine transport system substrate-binding protein
MRLIGLAVVLTMGLTLASLVAEAQSTGSISRVGVLSFGPPPVQGSSPEPNEAFRKGLRDLGYVEGRNVAVELRYANTRTDRLAQLAADLVRLKMDVIFAGGPVVLDAVRKLTTSIPVVVVCCNDAVREGWAQSLARPGGNVTGLTVTFPEVGSKRLQLLKEALPGLSRVAVLAEPAEISNFHEHLKILEDSARVLGVHLRVLEVRGPNDFSGAFKVARQGQVEAVETFDTAKLLFHRTRLAELAVANRLASVGEFRPFAEAGFLMTYGADLNDLARRAATYVDKILKGAKPADLPVEQPTKFELVINLKTAKALNLTIPQSVLARADQIIE